MPILSDFPRRTSSYNPTPTIGLEDRFEIIKDIGDGSFGSVTLARVRTAGASVARRGTLVAIKTMKKTFESFAPCLELREVTFLRSLPTHTHLVPALDIFLDPMTKKLHICMEYMDGNLYQLMKSRDHKCLDGSVVKSILFQILTGLDHIHAHNFFHRDIKPENILVSSASAHDSNSAFRRYSSLSTPPSTPSMYSIKIADFGLARETHSKLPYTTYVSTRWYRAPEVLLRAGEYSAPVDMWAIGAMAVEVATLKPLFPGGNEVDQVWRVCEIMGSPGRWYNRSGGSVGGGEWKEGTRLASKLGFSFPKMAPHPLESILPLPQWPVAFSNFVRWCLMWDPKNRPTSTQAMQHEFFADAIDPLSPKATASKLLGRKQSSNDARAPKDVGDGPVLTTKSSWFRKSLIGRDSTAAVSQHPPSVSHNSSPIRDQNASDSVPSSHKQRANAAKRATWANGSTMSGQAPMHILPSIRPISPLSAAVTAQANNTLEATSIDQSVKSKKIGRQLSVQSNGNHYGDLHRAEAALNGHGGLASPTNGQKESFFSHLRKRARRFSGRHQTPISPKHEDLEANAGTGAWRSNRSSMALDPNLVAEVPQHTDFEQLDKALNNVRYTLEASSPAAAVHSSQLQRQSSQNVAAVSALKRHHSVKQGDAARSNEDGQPSPASTTPVSSRTRRAMQYSNHAGPRYETFNEEEELLDEALNGVSKAVRHMDHARRSEAEPQRSVLTTKDGNTQPMHYSASHYVPNPYPTPSPSAKRNSETFRHGLLAEPATPLMINKTRNREENQQPMWPTPPYEENEWAASAAASILAAGSGYR